MTKFKNKQDFLTNYQAFLQLHALLYHPLSCPYTEPTALYLIFVQDLLHYMEMMTQEERNEMNDWAEKQQKLMKQLQELEQLDN